MKPAAALAVSLALAACTESGPGEVVPPDDGPVHRFVVDSIDIVRIAGDDAEYAADLNGDARADARVNQAIALLLMQGATTPSGGDQVRAGVIASTVEITAANLDDAEAAIRYVGRDGAASEPVGGRFVDGSLVSNRSRDTAYPGHAELVLPVIRDADPSVVPVDFLEMELTPASAGGYDLVMRGGIPRDAVLAEAERGIFQMLAANPQDHRTFAILLDEDDDGYPDEGALVRSPIFGPLFAADLQDTHVSFWVRVHLAPCAEGRCAEPAAPTAFDRIQNGSETDVDCGGDAMPCGDGARCALADDCFSGTCNAGQCADATCADGILNGFEAAIDCGGPCGPCESGAQCDFAEDCASGRCGAETTECL